MQSSNNRTVSITSSNDETTFITEPTKNDVLFGRGASTINFEGNKRFRQLVGTRKAEYVSTSRHQTKQDISNEILQEITKRNGRFLRPVDWTTIKNLKLPKETKLWVLATEAEVLEKIKQTLRDPNTSTKCNRKETKHETENNFIPQHSPSQVATTSLKGQGKSSPHIIDAGHQGIQKIPQESLRDQQLMESLRNLASLRENNLLQRRLLLQEEIARKEAINRAVLNRFGLVHMPRNQLIHSLACLPGFTSGLSQSSLLNVAHRLPLVQRDLRSFLQESIESSGNVPRNLELIVGPGALNRPSELASLLGTTNSSVGLRQVDPEELVSSQPASFIRSEKKRNSPNGHETFLNSDTPMEQSFEGPSKKMARINKK